VSATSPLGASGVRDLVYGDLVCGDRVGVGFVFGALSVGGKRLA
jgi:hypothetical protein